MKLVKKLVLPMLIAVFAVCVILATPIFKADAATTYYTVAGTSALCGSNWNPSDTKNDMTAIDGGYLKVFTNVAAGTHEFKVTKDHGWNTSWGDNGGNYWLQTTKKGYVAVYFSPSSGTVIGIAEHGGARYRIAGTKALCGSEWAQSDNNNLMHVDGELLTKTYTNVPAGTHEFKVVRDGDWNKCWGNSGANYKITLSAACPSLTISFNPLTNKITHSNAVVTEDTYTIAGTSSLCGAEWDPSATANAMTKQANGTYSKTYTNVPAGTHELKVVLNGDWNTCWGNGSANYVIKLTEACDELTITFNPSTGKITHQGTVATVDTYIVAGISALCGSEWSATDTNNQMTKQANGTYTKVYSNVAKGNYSIKVVKNGSDWLGDEYGQNIDFGVSSVCNVTVTYNPTTGKITVSGASVGELLLTIDYVTAVGNGKTGWLNGKNWIPDASANKMTEVSDGVYTITYNNVPKGNGYQVKFAANGGWTINWGGTFTASGTTTDAWFNSSNIEFNVTYYTANVVIVLDLSNFDQTTKNGAKFTITITDSHTHSYSQATCTSAPKCVCGATNGSALGHSYDHACDVDCNVCGATRTPSEHAYDHACDADCNVCGATRTPADHVWANACDADCNVCGATRTPADHVYDHACDVDCNVCGATRTPADHVYDNTCDAECNVCGHDREAGAHAWDNACDVDCNICGATRTPADHVYDHACDVDCNVCGATRTPADHVYDNNCDADCNVCGATRTPADHVYDNGCDAKCNECDASREELTHTYSDAQDKYCDICGFERHDRVVLDGFKGCQGYVDGIIAVLALAGLAVVKAVSDKSKK